jgi:hypothetical protein
MEVDMKKTEREIEIEKYFGMGWKRFCGMNRSVRTKEHALRLLGEIMERQKDDLRKGIKRFSIQL